MLHFELLDLLKNIASDPKTLESARLQEQAFTRNRKMTFPSALSFLLDMRKTTLQTRLNLYFDQVKEGEPISQQAFTKLRANFDHSPFQTMLRMLVQAEYSGAHSLPLWNGYHLFGVDGSYLLLPRAKPLREEFGVRGNCPCAKVSILYDVLHGWVLDPIIADANSSEHTLCEEHTDFLRSQLPHISKNSIILLDRGYPSLDLLGKLQKSGVKFVARCNSRFVKEINDAPLGDSVAKLKNGTCVRIIKFALSTGEIETLATNLFEFPEENFPELYALRWGVETAYFRMKRELCVEKFSGRTANSVRQDFWTSMVLMNSVAVFQREADEVVRERRKANGKAKCVNHARTSDLIITLRDRFVFAVLCDRPLFCEAEMKRIIKTMARVVSPVRPRRSFPRIPRPYLLANHNLKSHL